MLYSVQKIRDAFWKTFKDCGDIWLDDDESLGYWYKEFLDNLDTNINTKHFHLHTGLDYICARCGKKITNDLKVD